MLSQLVTRVLGRDEGVAQVTLERKEHHLLFIHHPDHWPAPSFWTIKRRVVRGFPLPGGCGTACTHRWPSSREGAQCKLQHICISTSVPAATSRRALPEAWRLDANRYRHFETKTRASLPPRSPWRGPNLVWRPDSPSWSIPVVQGKS